MDPTETAALIGLGPDADIEWVVACEDLYEWLDNGGFAPDWRKASSKAISRWNEYHRHLVIDGGHTTDMDEDQPSDTAGRM